MATRRSASLPLVAVLLLVAVMTACGGAATGPAITASVLVESSADDPRWFRDLEVPDGTDGYELLEAAVGADLESEWFPQFRSHFVSSILGMEAENRQFWGFFVWSETSGAWEPLPIGADLLAVKEGHIIGWALVEFDPDSPQVPTSTP